MTNVAFIGLGVMGYPMAGHILQSGHTIKVYNRTSSKAKKWVDHYGGKAYETPKLAAQNVEIICICVGNDNDLRSVVYGDDGVLAGAKPGTIIVDHTTASAEIAREIGEASQKLGISFLDAPSET